MIALITIFRRRVNTGGNSHAWSSSGVMSSSFLCPGPAAVPTLGVSRDPRLLEILGLMSRRNDAVDHLHCVECWLDAADADRSALVVKLKDDSVFARLFCERRLLHPETKAGHE